VETFDGGVNVLLHHSKEKALKRFEAILEEVFFNPNWTRARINKELEGAIKSEHYSVCDGDSEQHQTIQIQTLDYED
jgi:hypothetical protein